VAQEITGGNRRQRGQDRNIGVKFVKANGNLRTREIDFYEGGKDPSLRERLGEGLGRIMSGWAKKLGYQILKSPFQGKNVLGGEGPSNLSKILLGEGEKKSRHEETLTTQPKQTRRAGIPSSTHAEQSKSRRPQGFEIWMGGSKKPGAVGRLLFPAVLNKNYTR